LSYTGFLMPLHLTLRRSFVADHFHDRPGFQEARHGHNWKVEATLRLEPPEREAGCAQVLGAALDAWVREVDYTLLNDQAALGGCNPTTEALAHWAFDFLAKRGLAVEHVKVREKANYWAACRR